MAPAVRPSFLARYAPVNLLLRRAPAALLAAALVAVPAQAKGPGRAVKGPTVEGITEYSLPNGMRVLLFPDPSKPTVTVNVTYFVGSRHEGYGETGMAHLLEHLLFKGTPTTPNVPQALIAASQRLGLHKAAPSTLAGLMSSHH